MNPLPPAQAGRAPVRLLFVSLIVFALSAVWITYASDHSDAPQSETLVRQDANLTDLHAFVAGPNLVISLCANPAIPKSATSYIFPTDVAFEINIDIDSPVSADDPLGMGGTIVAPDRISEDVVIRIRFGEDGTPKIQVLSHQGQPAVDIVNFFAGLRDDPFIRGPRQGRNVAAIVLEIPLASVTTAQSTLLLWATSKVDEFDGVFQDLAGRSLRSMMPENKLMNLMHPRHQLREMGHQPDVMIFDTARPAAFPNGRALSDDVVDLVGDPRVLGNDAPFPAANDLPFSASFPYLAPPHPAP